MSSRYVIEVGNRHIKDVNEEIQAAAKAHHSLLVRNTLSRHNLGIGLPKGVDVAFEGSVGYYCGGLNTGAIVTVEDDAGWGTGEGMDAGHITIGGYAGMSAGAAMRGGTIHVRGDAGPRIGVAMKGGNIIVEGKIGSQAGFMAHAGKIIALGGAGASCADALWQGEVWVAGEIESLGVDAVVKEPTAEQVAEVDAILEPLGLVDSARNWRRIVSGQRLWYFESRDANAWLMI
ncbi:GltB/FmdC/FwdC-like GXGXG domain-containing protein [Acidocella aromatica]|uniref:Glutamate synthase domain-containing protein 3 n=1 Tax=Acidocella aromatica TaxID=1303579 RepID=A0A840VBI9_9PROT|nr:glutamate synthase [Acidocella aromatica]MBB5372197.1 glutamate synthase domain-containing protein 3 [Acidocella aromatica]